MKSTDMASNAIIKVYEMQTNNLRAILTTFRTVALVQALSSTAVLAQVAYPAAVPSAAGIFRDGSQIVISNTAVCGSWRVGEAGLKPTSVADAASQRQLTLTSEAFEIVLTNGQRYAASALRPEGPVRLSDLTPDAKAARLAARIPGRQAEVSLSSADERLRVIWRALLHDGGNYIR
ncbi:MAG: hypothetical protein NT154_07745 [Verrucomicrobia bacterium]|nr:hypothetical protein [Verrucomicrobiota bacterium]